MLSALHKYLVAQRRDQKVAGAVAVAFLVVIPSGSAEGHEDLLLL